MNDASLTQRHPRTFRDFRYVYPVVSRRSAGISIGVNLCRQCNFSCVYCQVLGEFPNFDRNRAFPPLDLAILETELRDVLELVRTGKLFEDPHFSRTPKEKRRLNDIALSGDGEPTLSPLFAETVERLVEVRREFSGGRNSGDKNNENHEGGKSGETDPLKLVLITNAGTFHVKHVAQSIQVLLENGGEIWAKLDAGTEETYRRISRSRIPFSRILENITETARNHPIVVQSIFLRDHGVAPDARQVGHYIERLRDILVSRGRLRSVQVYTVARKTPDPDIRPLDDETLRCIAQRIREETSLNVETFFSR